MISYFGVRSLLDVGCGKGISTSWFYEHGVDTHCVEGSHDAVTQSILPDPTTQVTEHDFSRGPWWPEQTVDAVWCVEFTEHVGRNYHSNYVPAFKKAALVFVTHSNWGGWHHVEVHDDKWWRTKWEMQGLVYSEELTAMVRAEARAESARKVLSPNGKDYYYAQHIIKTMQVFINPEVAMLPRHSGLMAEDGCYGGKKEGGGVEHVKCGGVKKNGQMDEQNTPMDP
ncbi:hypothetical protein ScalyP_jg1192, partial [Parmales sp. scaly parma]